jgi:hypothetical protein
MATETVETASQFPALENLPGSQMTESTADRTGQVVPLGMSTRSHSDDSGESLAVDDEAGTPGGVQLPVHHDASNMAWAEAAELPCAGVDDALLELMAEAILRGQPALGRDSIS